MAIFEIALSVKDRLEGRAEEGDIIVAREPLGRIGAKERKNLLWLLVESSLSRAELMKAGAGRKRKHHFPLASVLTARPGYNLVSVRDDTLDYQPEFQPNARGDFTRNPTPINIDPLLQQRV